MNKLISHTIAAVLCAVGLPLAADSRIVLTKLSAAPDSTVHFENAVNSSDVVLPHLGNSSTPDWSKAWHSPAFTLQYSKAVQLAHAFQGAGEWKQLLPQMLIPKQETSLEAGWSDEFLWLRVTSLQKQMERLKALPVSYKRDGAVYGNENIDISFTANRNSDQYWQIISDFYGTTYDALQFRNGKSDLDWNPDLIINTQLQSDKWILTIALPLKALGFAMKRGEFVDINVGRVELTNTEISSLGPIQKQFKEPDRMIRLWFGEKRELAFIKNVTVKKPAVGDNDVEVLISNPSQQVFKGNLQAIDKNASVSLQPGEQKTHVLKWNAKAGKETLTLCLKNAQGDNADSVAIPIVIPPALSLTANTREAMTGENITAEIAICSPVKNGSLVISFAGETTRAPVDFERAKLVIRTNDLLGKYPIKLELKDSTGAVCAIFEDTLTILEDPFAE